ncbi:molybdopterin-dependent oxidoreductase [Nocardioides marmotae]|uniref:molybdopterin-dependent oxidoreductase n=1 Tax=Nocardioides marmotae TaxID=2663857 RepID=UPI0013278FC3|nr:molybdopterin-dependent oxidoreductase [Nocardioides marmotae]MBC9733514.1 molybdopterin-dependent oxidoreductase [Nocardioides marmotae]MTB84621.1 molybdopterin-dependent oxidoreductase [Nocardioides marmotae]
MRAPRSEDFTSPLHGPALASRVGPALGVCFAVCFLTGLLSHYAQQPSQPVPFPTSPAWGYRLTQGLHVVTGTAAVPLLLVKLWTVYPRLFQRPARLDLRHLALTALERLSVLVLVASAVFMLVTGLANASQWYPWSFSFRTTHYAVAWVAIGALVLHVAVKLPVVRDALRRPLDDDPPARSASLSRRGLLRATWLAAGVAVLATAGSTVPWLRRVSVLGVRSGDGPQGLPINTSAAAAGVTGTATAPGWALTVVHGARSVRLTRADLLALEQRTEELPIACVEGWSASGTWTGVRVRDLLDEVGAPRGSDVVVRSLQRSGPYRTTVLQAGFADDDRTLVALALGGEPLALDHGHPARLIAPNRPGVLQTKWLDRLEVLA